MKPVVAPLVFAWLLSSAGLAQVIDTKQYAEPKLKEGECHTVDDSKVYLKNIQNTNNPSAYTSTVNEIGANVISQLENTNEESYFFCKLKCVLKSETHTIWITQKDRNENTKNMNGFVCAGLDIRDVAVSSTLTIKTTVAIPFMAVQSPYSEVHDKLKNISYTLSTQAGSALLTDFYTIMLAIQTAYSMASSEIFHNASTQLLLFSPENPQSLELLKEKVKTFDFSDNQEKKSILDYKSSDDLVLLFFKMHGRFIDYLE